jgi:hypothetical protein
MSQLFGFIVKKGQEDRGQSPIQPNQDDGATVAAGGYFGTYLDIEGVQRNEFDLIKRYRDMSLHPECDSAVDEIVNEFVVSDAKDSPVEIELSNLPYSAGIKTKIRKEFEYIKKMLHFDKKAHQIIRNWYIDGRLHYHKVIDLENPRKGILELRYIDSLKIRKVRQQIKDKKTESPEFKGSALQYDWGNYIDYYIYNPKGFGTSVPKNSASDFSTHQGIKITEDSIATCDSGLQDLNKKITLSFLHKAIKSLNQLRMIEDSLVIYRLSRAPERRIFYIDVGNLPKVKAEQYLRDVMGRYRNKQVYDQQTGEMRDDKKHMSMLEDFWLPRREGGKGTEITSLPGGENLGQIDDIIYFQKKMYRALNVPINRLEQEAQFSLGRSSEITRDELKFQKFINRLRKRFAHLFYGILKKQLILKGIIAENEWNDLKNDILVDYQMDNHFTELKDAEILREKLQSLDQVSNYVGEYFSKEWIMKNVLHFNDEDIETMQQQMSGEQPQDEEEN